MKAHRVLQTALSNAFCHLIASCHDPSEAVAQRALLTIKAIPSASLKVCPFVGNRVEAVQLMVLCLESQFTVAIVDRPLILQRLQLLASVLGMFFSIQCDFNVEIRLQICTF